MSSFGTAPNAMRNRSKILSDKDQDLLGICSCSQCSYVKILAGSMYLYLCKDLCGFTLPALDRHQFLFRANSCAVRGGLPALDTAAWTQKGRHVFAAFLFRGPMHVSATWTLAQTKAHQHIAWTGADVVFQVAPWARKAETLRTFAWGTWSKPVLQPLKKMWSEASGVSAWSAWVQCRSTALSAVQGTVTHDISRWLAVPWLWTCLFHQDG